MTLRSDPLYREYLKRQGIPLANQMRRVWRWADKELRLGVAVFHGDKGNIKIDRYITDMPRELAPFSTGLCSGRFFKYKSSDGQERLYLPGETTDGDPDIKKGFVECRVEEDQTVLICIGPISKVTGFFAWEPMQKTTHYSRDTPLLLELKRGHVGAVVLGEVRTTTRVVKAPGVVVAKKKDLSIVLEPNSVMMEGWR